MDLIREKRIPHVIVSGPSSSSTEDIEKLAVACIRKEFHIKTFEILHVEQLQVSDSRDGISDFIVAFQETRGEVLYIHPNCNNVVG